jgi:small subunit ribosomal protein S17
MERSKRKVFSGKIIGDKMNKTRVVEIERTFRHGRYSKVMHKKSKLYAHDEKNETHLGDLVSIMETRPLSKMKRWQIVKVMPTGKIK